LLQVPKRHWISFVHKQLNLDEWDEGELGDYTKPEIMKVLMHNIGFFLDQHLTLFRSKNLTSIIKATITQLL